MCNKQWQALDVLAFSKEMTLVEQILYDIRVSNERYEFGGDVE